MLEHLCWLLAIDARSAVEEMVADGWPARDAAEAVRHWLLEENLTMAIDSGLTFAQALAS